jgi:hypothetical protein
MEWNFFDNNSDVFRNYKKKTLKDFDQWEDGTPLCLPG